jgi:hypothetical protein
MKFIIKLFASLLFAISLPVIGLGQNRSIAQYMCHKFNGELTDKKPIALKNRFYKDPYACSIKKNGDSLSVYHRARNLISNNKNWEKVNGNDWRISPVYGEDHRFIILEIKFDIYVILIIPVKTSDQFYILVDDKR